MVKRQAVGAHYGLGDWLVQRITGLVIAIYTVVLLALLVSGMDLDRWQELSTHTTFRLLTFLALVSVFVHAWVGMRDIVMDYVRATAVRLSLEVLIVAALVAYAGWAIQILWGGR